MQRLEWYVRRLRGMSAGEIAWRLRSHLRDTVDRARVGLGRVPRAPRPRARPRGASRLRGHGHAARRLAGRAGRGTRWRDALVAQADAAAAHRLSFFDLDDADLGDPIDWNRDHAAGTAAPHAASPPPSTTATSRVDGRLQARVGAEPPPPPGGAGRAYRATGDARYARAVAEQLESWLDQCPFGRGMNWRSPLELAIRLINWVWALDLVARVGLLDGAAARARAARGLAPPVGDRAASSRAARPPTTT